MSLFFLSFDTAKQLLYGIDSVGTCVRKKKPPPEAGRKRGLAGWEGGKVEGFEGCEA